MKQKSQVEVAAPAGDGCAAVAPRTPDAGQFRDCLAELKLPDSTYENVPALHYSGSHSQPCTLRFKNQAIFFHIGLCHED